MTIYDENNAESTILYRDIDYMAENYGLSLVSPDIVFDVGDVYGTGWLSYRYDLSAFASEFAGEDGIATIYLADQIYLSGPLRNTKGMKIVKAIESLIRS